MPRVKLLRNWATPTARGNAGQTLSVDRETAEELVAAGAALSLDLPITRPRVAAETADAAPPENTSGQPEQKPAPRENGGKR